MKDGIVKIRIATDADQKRWDEFVLQHPESSPYHLWAWRKAIEESYGHKCIYFYTEQNDEITGILPTVRFHVPGIINQIVALPFCDVGNCVADKSEVQDLLISEILEYCKNRKIKNLQFRGDLLQTVLIQTRLEIVETNKVRMFLNLPSTANDLLKSFRSKLRSQVRKAEKNGVTFRWGNIEDIENIFRVFSKNMHELGSPVHSKAFLKSVLEQYDERAKVGIAEFENNIIGIGIILLGARGVSIPWASTLREYNRLSPNMLLYWNLLKYSADNGYEYFDFGRSSEGEGTYRFKKQWGAISKPLVWYELKDNDKKEKSSKESKIDKRELLAGMWRKLPLGMANVIGPHIRKYISL